MPKQGQHLIVKRSAQSDEELVDAAVLHVQRLWREGLLTTVVAVGDYLIEKFYQGDLELAASRRLNKPMALSQLLDRAEELPVSVHALRQSVRIAVQYHSLPKALADGLSKEQHTHLLRVDDLREKRTLAEDALRDGLNGRQLDRLTRKLKRPHPGGRPGRPALIARVEGALRIIDEPTLASLITQANVRRLSSDERQYLATIAGVLRDAVGHVEDAVLRAKG